MPLQSAMPDIDRFYGMGVASREEHQGRMPMGSMKGYDPHSRYQAERLRKARTLQAAYTRRELAELLGNAEIVGFPLRVSHVIRLMAVQNKAERDRLERRMLRERWSVRRLNAAIRQLQGTGAPGPGRRRMPPRDAVDVLDRVVAACRLWQSAFTAVCPDAQAEAELDGNEAERLRAIRDQVPRSVTSAMRKLQPSLARLRKLADKALRDC